jgi:hypothetical protein
LKATDTERNQLADSLRKLNEQDGKREVFIQGLENEINTLNKEIEKLKTNNHNSDVYFKLRESEK